MYPLQTSSSVSGVASPAEQHLQEAKEALAQLAQLASQAEHGGTIDFPRAYDIVNAVATKLQQLAQGSLPAVQDGKNGGAVTTSGQLGPSLSARVHSSGGAAITELQKRRAQQLLSELQLNETMLQRSQRKLQQRQTHASELSKLKANMSDARTDYSELQHLDEEQKGIHYARRRMQQMQAESEEVLQALQGQGRRLGGVGDKMGDLMESLGVSNSTILQIVRRNQVDAWLVYGGIIFLLIMLWYILW